MWTLLAKKSVLPTDLLLLFVLEVAIMLVTLSMQKNVFENLTFRLKSTLSVYCLYLGIYKLGIFPRSLHLYTFVYFLEILVICWILLYLTMRLLTL